MTSLTRLLAFVAILVICAAAAIAGLVVLGLVLDPVIRLAAQALDVVFTWMAAHDKATSLALLAIVGAVLAMIVLEDGNANSPD